MITVEGDLVILQEKPDPLTLEELVDPRLISPPHPSDVVVDVRFRVPYQNRAEFLNMLRKYGMDLG